MLSPACREAWPAGARQTHTCIGQEIPIWFSSVGLYYSKQQLDVSRSHSFHCHSRIAASTSGHLHTMQATFYLLPEQSNPIYSECSLSCTFPTVPWSDPPSLDGAVPTENSLTQGMWQFIHLFFSFCYCTDNLNFLC